MKFKEGRDYIFIDINRELDEGEIDKITGIQITKGKYKDVVYHYNKARVVEEGALARLQFGFTILNPGEHDIDLLQNDEEFVIIMGDLLTEIMLAKAKDEQNRTDNSQEFNLQ
tara:strand:+ start:246 stop:584 length:339 start_codon:yes stop_codon:yes gene_type:complete